MAEEIPKLSNEQVVACLLRLGELLVLHSRPIGALGLSRRIRPAESERLKAEIAELEKRIEVQAYNKSCRTLRSVLGLQKDEVLDMIFLRCIAVVAFEAMDNHRPVSTVSGISRAAGLGDWEATVSARHAIRQAIIKGNSIIYSEGECEGAILKPGKSLTRLLSGENQLAILWTEESIRQEKEEYIRRQGLRQTPLPKSVSEPAPASRPLPPSALKECESPKAIFNALRENVIGMDPVVRKFAVQMAIHMKRVAIAASGGVLSTPPVCVLCCGPSGSGKSFLASEFGRLSGLPFAIGDMSSVTASAYVGSSVDELFYGFAKNGTKLADAQNGILFLDEIDKKRTNNRGGDFDATGVGVQFELLRMLEGTRIQIGGKRSGDSVPRGFLDSTTMAFVMAGAFSDISIKLRESTKARAPLGFSGGNAVQVQPDTRELLLEYFIPELVSRIGSVIVIPPPSMSQLVLIATAPTGIIARQNKFLSSFSLQVKPTPEAVNEIASWALESRTFARGMRSLCQSLVEEAIFEEQKGEVTIETSDVRRAIEGLKTETAGLQ